MLRTRAIVGRYAGKTRIASHYRSHCKSCGKPIQKSDEVAQVKLVGLSSNSWVHQDCARGVALLRPDGSVLRTADGERVPRPEPKSPNPVPPTPMPELDSDLPDAIGKVFGSLFDGISGLQTRLSEIESNGADGGESADRIQVLTARFEDELQKIADQQPRRIEVKLPNEEVHEVEGEQHELFEKILKYVTIGEEIFLPGPTGCGKTHICQQIADALKKEFRFMSCSGGMSEGHLLGRLLPIGKTGSFKYVVSEFVKAYENGGLFLLDEMDASDDNVLLCLNSALANGKMHIPNRVEKAYAVRHPEFVMVGAANTFGTGANRDYCGRNKLDGATMNRFQAGTIAMDYDERLERKLCQNSELFDYLLHVRKIVRENRMERFVTTRTICKFSRHLQCGLSMNDCKDRLYTPWTRDEVAKADPSYARKLS